MNRQDELPTGEEVEDGRGEVLSAEGDGGQAAVSPVPDDDTGSASLLDSVLPTLLGQRSSDVWEAALAVPSQRMTRKHWIAPGQLLRPLCALLPWSVSCIENFFSCSFLSVAVLSLDLLFHFFASLHS